LLDFGSGVNPIEHSINYAQSFETLCIIPGITDEFVIGLSYETLDMILYGLQSGLPHDQIVDQCNCNPGLVKTVDSWMAKSSYKRDTPYFLDFAF
jgi:NH3-dependent NAD+ synthetase